MKIDDDKLKVYIINLIVMIEKLIQGGSANNQ